MPESKPLALSILVDPCTLKTDHYQDCSVFYKLRFVTINEKDEVRNCSSSFTSEPFAGFDNLIFRCYISWNPGIRPFTADSWEMLYDSLYSVGLSDAELHVKTLKRIRKIEDKFVVRPASFGQFVAMVASALGIKRFVRVRGGDSGWHHENDYQFLEIKYLADAIDREIDKAREAKFPTVQPEALTA